jgi:glycosyltransferase involved in cell wall biosynthesis
VRIGIDISRLATAQKTGTERYTWEVLSELAAQPTRDTYTLYCRDLPADVPDLPAHMHIRHIPMRRLWTHVRLAAELWRDPPHALFVPSHVLPWNVPFIRGLRVVTTIHDLGFLHFPAAHTTFQNAYLRLTTMWAARVAHRVIAISEATAADFIAYTGIARDRVSVIPHGVSPRFHPHAATPQPWSRYLLYVGTLQPRKNLLRLIQAFAHAETHPETQLVIAGRIGWLSEPLAEEIGRLGLTGRVHLIGYVADADLPGLIAQARGFVFPSLYEGFGMPVLEAMASGTPVLCANTSALPEVAGDAAILVDPLNVSAIATGITRLDGDDATYADYRQRGLERVKMYSWRRCAQATIAAVTGDA